MIKSTKSNAVVAAGSRDVHTPEPSALKSSLEGSLRFIDTRHAAAILGLSPRTLEKFRVHGGGPAYRKFGGRVLYALEDLDAWAALAVRTSTPLIHLEHRHVKVHQLMVGPAGRQNATGDLFVDTLAYSISRSDLTLSPRILKTRAPGAQIRTLWRTMSGRWRSETQDGRRQRRPAAIKGKAWETPGRSGNLPR